VSNDGTFTFNALPPEMKNKHIPIYAVYYSKQNQLTSLTKATGVGTVTELPTSTTIVGDFQKVLIPAQQDVVLNLTELKGVQIDNIAGFPFQPVAIQAADNNHYKVSGIVKLKGYSPGFDILNEENIQFHVLNVEMEQKNTLNGVKIYGSVANDITLINLKSFKLKYCKTFNTEFASNDENELKITSSGTINGNVHIVDNSFQYPSSYLSFDDDQAKQFYFYSPVSVSTSGVSGMLNNSSVCIFNSASQGNGNSVIKFNLKRKDEYNLKFKFIGFETTAKSSNSYIKGDEITLDATLETQMKNASPDATDAQNTGSSTITVHVPQLVLKNNVIEEVSGSEPLLITLNDGGEIQNTENKWVMEAKSWRINPSEGGLVSENIILHTGKVDVPFTFFNLRSDFAYLDEPDMTKIKIGEKTIHFEDGAKSQFGYNTSCGSDRGAHWQLIMYPATIGQPVGTVNFNETLEGSLELETVSLLSNNENVFSISPGAEGMKLYKMAAFTPISLYTFTNGFELTGSTNLTIPRLGSVSVTLKFISGSNMTVKPMDFSFIGKGNVVFRPDLNISQTWSDNKLVVYGTVEEPDKLDPIKVKLDYTYRKSGTDSTIITASDKAIDQVVKIGESNTRLKTVKASMKADENDWNNLTFEGDLDGFDGLQGFNHMKFTVFGEIKASNQSLNSNGMDGTSSKTPFGNMEITYESGRLLGSLTLENVPIGSFIANGVMHIVMDKNGWLFYGNLNVPNVPLPDPCTLNMGLLIGYYKAAISSDIESTVLYYAIRKEWPESFDHSKLLGFYAMGGRNLPFSGLDKSINLGVASAYIEVPVAAIDGYVYLNAVGNSKVGMGINGKVQVNFGLNAITCTSLYGSAVACVNIQFSDQGAKLCTGLGYTLGIKQEIPLVCDCGSLIFDGSISKSASFQFTTNPLNAEFRLDLNGCPLCQ
jgi:hypothetical protein